MMDDGWVCVECDEWFEVLFSTGAAEHVNYCPLCGYKFTEEDIDLMDAENEALNADD